MKSSKFLLIDDDALFVTTLARALERRGFYVQLAMDRASALACACQFKPDFVVLDLRLAEESGLNVLQDILAILPETQIVMLTGYSSLATAVEAVKRGAVNYLAKPADCDTILRSLSLAPKVIEAESEQLVSVDRLAWEHIQRVLLEEGGNISATARRLGMHRRTLQRRLHKRPLAN